MKVDSSGWLEANASGLPEIVKIPSVRTCLYDPPSVPMGLVWHWTGGRGGAKFAVGCAEEIRTYTAGVDRPASWHVMVCRDGRLVQSVSFDKGAWHVGRPGRIGQPPVRDVGTGVWTVPTGRLYGNVNRGTVGVELENAGRLEKVGDNYYCWPYWLHPDDANSGPDHRYEVAASRAQVCEGQFYDNFPAEQEQAATRLLQALTIRYKWPRAVSGYGHLMFDFPRKQDPGPLWLTDALPRIQDLVYGPVTS